MSLCKKLYVVSCNTCNETLRRILDNGTDFQVYCKKSNDFSKYLGGGIFCDIFHTQIFESCLYNCTSGGGLNLTGL